MSEHVKKLLMLYENGIIDGDALNTALKAQPPPQEPQKKLSQIKQEKDVAEKRKGGNKERQKLRIRKMKHPENPHFSLWIKPNVVISERMKFPVKRYKDPVKMFQDKKCTIKNKITAELQELTGLKWSFGLTVDFFKDDKKI